MAESIGGGFVEQLGQLLAQACEIFLRRQRTGTIGLAALRIRIDQIHIRGKIQLAPTKLAQPEHHQPLHTAVFGNHLAVAVAKLLLQCLQPTLQAGFGQAGGTGQVASTLSRPSTSRQTRRVDSALR